MKPQINPAWLVSLMTRWALRQSAAERNAIGWYSKCPGFSEKTTGGYNHSNPTAFSVEDFRELDAALKWLLDSYPERWTAMVMYYKPWTIQSLVSDGHPHGNSTYYKRLHLAHEVVAKRMDSVSLRNIDKMAEVE